MAKSLKMVLCLLFTAWWIFTAWGAATRTEAWEILTDEPYFGLQFMPRQNQEVPPKSYFLHNPAFGGEVEVYRRFDYQFMPTQEQGEQPKSHVLRSPTVGGVVPVYTNAIGLLRGFTVYPQESESQPPRGNFRMISMTTYELYPLPGQAATNRILKLSWDNENTRDELHWLVGREVRVEGCLFGCFIVTNVAEHGASKSLAVTNLNRQQAHALAKKLLRFHLKDRIGDSAFKRTAPPKLIDGRWVWEWRGGSGTGDLEARISFAKDGTSSQYEWQSFTSEVPMLR